jgi:hypothetical protein
MGRRIVTAALVGLIFVVSGCQDEGPLAPVSGDQPLLDQGGVPSDGNGNKFVFTFVGSFPVNCGGEIITQHFDGWGQFHTFGPPNNRNVELGVFHFIITYVNASGDEFVWNDVGPDLYYEVDGVLFVAITGRSTASGDAGRNNVVLGHVVIRDPFGTPDVVFVAGKDLGPVNDLACDALT